MYHVEGFGLEFFQRIAPVSIVLWQDHENDIFKLLFLWLTKNAYNFIRRGYSSFFFFVLRITCSGLCHLVHCILNDFIYLKC